MIKDAKGKMIKLKNRKNLLILALVGVALILYLIFSFFDNKKTVEMLEFVGVKNSESSDVIISFTSGWGTLHSLTIFGDRNFIIVNEWAQVSSEQELCYEGKISADSYKSLVDFIESKDFFNQRIEQNYDLGLMCDGRSGVEVKMGEMSNSLLSPCVNKPTESTAKALSVMEEISEKMFELTNREKKTCSRSTIKKFFVKK